MRDLPADRRSGRGGALQQRRLRPRRARPRGGRPVGRFRSSSGREVFAPLGMTSSGFWALDGIEPDLAIGYLPPDPEAAPGSPAAAWRTNVYACRPSACPMAAPRRPRRISSGRSTGSRVADRSEPAVPDRRDAGADDRAARDQPGREGGLRARRHQRRRGPDGADAATPARIPVFSSRCWVVRRDGRAGRRPVERDRGLVAAVQAPRRIVRGLARIARHISDSRASWCCGEDQRR